MTLTLMRIYLLVVILTLGAGMSLPVRAQTDEDIAKRCWTKDDCQKHNGIWGKSEEYKSNPVYGKGQYDNFPCRPIVEAGADTARCFAKPPSIPLQVGIPGITTKYCSIYTLGEEPPRCETDADCVGKGTCQPGIKEGFPGYVAAFYKFFVAALAVAAIVMVMWGGFKRIMAAGSPERISDANSTIMGAITGVVIALISYSLLQLINPQLVANSMPLIEKVKPQVWGNCPKYSDNPELYNAYIRQSAICSGGTLNGFICEDSKDCVIKESGGTIKGVAGTCIGRGEKFTGKPNFDTCGHILMLNGATCRGVECAKGGCFNNYGNLYRCAEYTVKGKMSGLKISKVDLLAVCSDIDFVYPCFVSFPGGLGDLQYINTTNKSYYAIGKCFLSPGEEEFKPDVCLGGSANFKGYALKIEVNDGADYHWYVVDSKSCTEVKSAPIIVNGISNPDTLDWGAVDRDQLFGITSGAKVLIPAECNLNITRENFSS